MERKELNATATRTPLLPPPAHLPLPPHALHSSNIAPLKAPIHHPRNMRRRYRPHALKLLPPNLPPPHHRPIPFTLMQHRRRPRILTRQHCHGRRLLAILTIINLPMHRALRKQCSSILRQVSYDLGIGAVGEEAALEHGARRDGGVGESDEEFGGARVDVGEEDAAGADGAEIDV
jgi:hypothetical protein